MSPTRNVLITGVSSGIGHALAQSFLENGVRVFGVSRRKPEDLLEHQRFMFLTLDLTDYNAVADALPELLEDVGSLDLVVLNAGILGRITDLSDASLDELKRTMEINLWANKMLIDELLDNGLRISQIVAISSGASINGHRGWSGYSLSKAALNMLIKLYAAENPETHCCALAPGLVDTAMQDYLASLPDDERYPSLERIRSRRGTSDMPTPEELAPRLIETMSKLPRMVDSGQYVDIRELPD
jgi:NAD(P)-dependent dehydrogenase (short-subunit alcohol dehydrogenase family)